MAAKKMAAKGNRYFGGEAPEATLIRKRGTVCESKPAVHPLAWKSV